MQGMSQSERRMGAVLGALALSVCLFSGCSPEPSDTGPLEQTGAASPQEAEPENQAPSSPRLIVLVSIDTLRADHLGLYGSPRMTSPTLDIFASEGTVFTDASSTSPWTLPAHASILTGRNPLNHGVMRFDSALPEEVDSLAGMLKSHGYQTAAVVNSTWLKKEPFRLTRDFDQYLFIDDTMDRRAPNTWITDQAINWISEHQDKPLFLFVHYYDVHADYASLPEYERLFVTEYNGEVDGTAWQLATASFEDDFLEMCHKEYDPSKCRIGTLEKYLAVDKTVEKLILDENDVKHLEQLYDAGIRQLDTELGRLFSAVTKNGSESESLVVIVSDHGEEFMEHGRVDHFLTVYQEILHVPLIFRGQGVPAGLRIDAPVSVIDIVPTVLTMAGLAVPEELDGLSLLPLMGRKPEAEFGDRFLYGEAAGGLSYQLMMDEIYPVYRSVRKGSYKLIYDSKADDAWLYDLSQDPYEQNDIRSEYPEVAEPLLAEMRARYSDFAPSPNPENQIDLESDELERLRALGYIR